MGKLIKRVVMSAALSLPLVTAIGAKQIPRGVDARVPQVPAVRAPLKVGEAQEQGGAPCRRSAADPLDPAPARPGNGHGPNSGCNLRLVKRLPADALIWV